MKAVSEITAVIRGEAPWQSLTSCGIDVRHEASEWEIRTILDDPVKAAPEDIATGLVNFSFRANELIEWASFLLASGSLISLERLQQSAEGDRLLEALWDVSAGKPVDDELLQRLKR